MVSYLLLVLGFNVQSAWQGHTRDRQPVLNSYTQLITMYKSDKTWYGLHVQMKKKWFCWWWWWWFFCQSYYLFFFLFLLLLFLFKKKNLFGFLLTFTKYRIKRKSVLQSAQTAVARICTVNKVAPAAFPSLSYFVGGHFLLPLSIDK